MNSQTLLDITIFWIIFYSTPGPVWAAVMAFVKDKSVTEIILMFIKVFTLVNIVVQVNQAILSVVFIDIINNIFADFGKFFYLIGALYIGYLAIKILSSATHNTSFQLRFKDLFVIMLFSPKIWTLFPAGGLIAYDLTQSVWVNALIFATIMLVVSSFFFFVYTIVAKTFYRFLKDKFNYVTFILLLFFAIFLLHKFFNLYS